MNEFMENLFIKPPGESKAGELKLPVPPTTPARGSFTGPSGDQPHADQPPRFLSPEVQTHIVATLDEYIKTHWKMDSEGKIIDKDGKELAKLKVVETIKAYFTTKPQLSQQQVLANIAVDKQKYKAEISSNPRSSLLKKIEGIEEIVRKDHIPKDCVVM